MPYVSGFDRNQLMCCSWDAFVNEESIARIIQENAQQNRLWLVNLDDFNTHYDSIINLSTDQVEYKNFHLHNALIGLNYSNITNFDTNHVMDRLGI